MKKFVKTIAVISSLALLATAFCGCSGDKKETVSNEDVSLTYWTMMDGTTARSLTSYSEMLMYQEMEKRTGIHVDFIHPIAGSTGNEAFLTMLSSSDMPDLMEYTWTAYTGGPQAAIDDGMIVALNDYLEDYAPNYYDYMEGEKGKANDYLYKLQASTDQGLYYGFNSLCIGNIRGFSGIYARADKLKEWNMEVPETIDDWEAVFAKAKAEGFKKPFTSRNDIISFNAQGGQGFNTAFGVGKDLYIEDGKVVFAPFQKGYKEYVALMADWTKKGYIDTSFITNNTQDLEGNMTNGISVAAFGWIGSALGKIMPAMAEKDPNFDLVACPYPVAKKGDKAEFQEIQPEAAALAIAVSAESANIEKAVEWCDYIYSDEGSVLRTFGVEGDTYTVVEIDGEKHYQYTDKVMNPDPSVAVSATQALYRFMLPANHPGLNQHPDYLNGYYPYQCQKDAVNIWNENVEAAKAHFLPTMSYTEDESQERAELLEIAFPELEAALCDIILGKKSIDTYDAAIKKAKANGYDRVIEITQAAYDRYISKK